MIDKYYGSIPYLIEEHCPIILSMIHAPVPLDYNCAKHLWRHRLIFHHLFFNTTTIHTISVAFSDDT